MKTSFTKGSEMTHNEFKEYVKSYESLFESHRKVLDDYIRYGELLSVRFCIKYEILLEDRLRFSRTCSEYYHAMVDKSFWFMKPLVLRRAMKFESIHYETLGRLMQLKTYMKLWLCSRTPDNVA